MFTFSQHSLRQLDNADGKLVKICYQVLKLHDFKVNETYRDKAAQEAAFARGATKLHFPHGNHNQLPSKAMDLFPFVGGVFIGFPDEGRSQQSEANARCKAQWCYFGGLVLGTAASLGIALRWGHDWNQDDNLFNQSFVDAPHFELV